MRRILDVMTMVAFTLSVLLAGGAIYIDHEFCRMRDISYANILSLDQHVTVQSYSLLEWDMTFIDGKVSYSPAAIRFYGVDNGKRFRIRIQCPK